jgi:hypothetical protein
MKPHPVPGTRCSTEDLADDEREDTSDAEQEPEPDYDEPIGNNIRDHQIIFTWNFFSTNLEVCHECFVSTN